MSNISRLNEFYRSDELGTYIMYPVVVNFIRPYLCTVALNPYLNTIELRKVFWYYALEQRNALKIGDLITFDRVRNSLDIIINNKWATTIVSEIYLTNNNYKLIETYTNNLMFISTNYLTSRINSKFIDINNLFMFSLNKTLNLLSKTILTNSINIIDLFSLDNMERSDNTHLLLNQELINAESQIRQIDLLESLPEMIRKFVFFDNLTKLVDVDIDLFIQTYTSLTSLSRDIDLEYFSTVKKLIADSTKKELDMLFFGIELTALQREVLVQYTQLLNDRDLKVFDKYDDLFSLTETDLKQLNLNDNVIETIRNLKVFDKDDDLFSLTETDLKQLTLNDNVIETIKNLKSLINYSALEFKHGSKDMSLQDILKFIHAPKDLILPEFKTFDKQKIIQMFDKLSEGLEKLNFIEINYKFISTLDETKMTILKEFTWLHNERDSSIFFEFAYLDMFRRWYFMPDDGPIWDPIILPMDYPYETLQPDGVSSHPIPNGANESLNEILVDVNIMSNVIDFCVELWHANSFLYTRYTPEQALKHFVNLLFDWLDKYIPDNIDKIPEYYPQDYELLKNLDVYREDYWRLYRWIRWYAEALILNVPINENTQLFGNTHVKHLIDDLIKYFNDHQGVYGPPGEKVFDKTKGVRHRWISKNPNILM